jgi:deoxyribodipyrimidine photo-lyase
VHEPWKHADGYTHGYPEPIVDHADERREALRRYEAVRG